MSVIGFNFNKISVERTGSKNGKITISNNVSITDISEAKIPFGNDKTKALKFNFSFSAKYEPKLANIDLAGDLLFMLDVDASKKILEEWKAKKQVSPVVMKPIINAVLNKCNIEALILSKEMNLPSPIPLPKVNTTPVKKK